MQASNLGPSRVALEMLTQQSRRQKKKKFGNNDTYAMLDGCDGKQRQMLGSHLSGSHIVGLEDMKALTGARAICEWKKRKGWGWESAADWLVGYLLVMLRQKSQCTMQRCAKSCQACSTSASVRKSDSDSDSDSDVDDTPLGLLRDERCVEMKR